MVATSASALTNDPTVSTCSSCVINATTTVTFYTPAAGVLSAGTTYYWEVHGRSTVTYGTWSTVWSFTTQGTVTVTWTTPPPSIVNSGQNFTVSWTTTGSPDHVNIHWDPTNPGTPSNPQGNIDPNNCVQSSTSCSTNSLTSSPSPLTAPVVSTSTVVKYVVHVSKSGSNDAFTPVISVTVNPACSPPTTTPISLTVGNSATSGCIGKGKVQTYSFSAQLDQNYSVILTPQWGDPDLYLSSSQSCINQMPYNSCGAQQSKNTTMLTDSLSTTATQTGTYYIAVYGYNSSAYNIQVLAKPLDKLDADNNAPTSGDTVTFTGVGSKGSSASCGINSYSWDFGDGTTGSGSSVTHSFTSSSGTTSYTVQLTVTDCIGQIDSTTMSITVTGQAAGTNNLSSKSNDPVNLATGNY